MTVALALTVLLLAYALAVVCLLWRAAVLRIRHLEQLTRHQSGRLAGYRAELDALSIAGPTVEQRVIAALNPDAHQQTLSDAWLAYVDSLPTLPTHERENPL